MLLERDLPKLSISSFPVYSSSQPTLNCSQYKNDNKTYIYLANFENTKPGQVSILSSLIHLHTHQTYLLLRGDHHPNSKCNIQSYVNYLNHNVH